MVQIRKGKVSDAQAFQNLLETVRAQMPHPEWFYLDPPEYVREQLEKGTMELWVAEDGEVLAGALSILILGEDPNNYGFDLGLSREDRARAVNMDSAAVDPRYRGQGLQRRLLRQAEEELKEAGMGILLCTVHPDNRYSLDNVLRQGYVIQKKLEKYDSVRFLLRKDIL